MSIEKNMILGNLPLMKGEEELLAEHQDVHDIMSAVILSHTIFAKDYDQIWNEFYSGDLNTIFEFLFNFCKKNIPYLEESDNLQTIKSPTAILAMSNLSGGDCKHYASFIGGVLDAINRNADSNIKWTYRFASYNILDNTPGHVFVVVNPGKDEIWIDPVLSYLDSREQIPYHKIDKKPICHSRIAGIYSDSPAGRMTVSKQDDRTRTIGSAVTTGQILQKIAPAAAAIPVVGLFASGALEIAGTIMTIFAKKNVSSDVRYLYAYYQINVVGVTNSYGQLQNENITIAQAAVAQAWFSQVLGLPIYDRQRFLILANRYPTDMIGPLISNPTYGTQTDLLGNLIDTNPNDNPLLSHAAGDSANLTTNQIVQFYQNFGGECADVSATSIIAAIPIATQMWSTFFNDSLAISATNQRATWQNMTSAPSLIDSSLSSLSSSAGGSNYLPWIALAGGGALFLLSKRKKKLRA